MASIFSIIGTLLSDSPEAKGKRGEWQSGFILKTLSSDDYHTFNDVTLHTADNATTQIDHVVISSFGIFVIEVKNYNGFIYGSEKQYKWTQVLNKNSKHQFLNPIIQNKKHLKTVQKVFGVADNHIHSVVVFMEKATFKTDMPSNVMTLIDMKSYIKSFTDTVFTERDCQKFTSRLNNRQLSRGAVANTVHMTHIKQKKQAYEEKKQVQIENKKASKTQMETVLDSQSNTEKQCPKCQAMMTKRQAKKGKNAGNYFYGCSAFPQCRHIETI